MTRDGSGGGPLAVERRRVALRALLAGGEASSSSATLAAADEAGRAPPGKGLLRGLRCTSVAAAQAFEPESALRSSADWRGLGCTSAAAHVHAPAAADLRGRRRRRGSNERRKARGGGVGSGGAGVVGDVWCAPGIPFAAEASSVDCVVAPHPHQAMTATRRLAQAERPHRERPGVPAARRVTMREHMSSSPTHSPPHHDMPLTAADSVPSGRNRYLRGRRHSRVRGEEEMVMFRTRILLGRMSMYDQYQDWRLDVDNMTYEELLDLEDRMGYVSTGLCEDEIIRSLRMVKHTPFNTKHFSTDMDRRCSICQEEFETDEAIGRLVCGHNYHVHCIKQWLSRKNSCPVCKTAISKT